MKIILQSNISSETVEEVVKEVTDDISVGQPAKVVLFNDEVHTFDEVISQIIKAIKCSRPKAESLTWEVHNNGRACVFSGGLKFCFKVNAVLEEIQLLTEIQL